MSFPLWPAAASGYAHEVDLLLICMLVLVGALSLPVAVALGVFALRYRQGREVNRTAPAQSQPQARAVLGADPVRAHAGLLHLGGQALLRRKQCRRPAPSR